MTQANIQDKIKTAIEETLEVAAASGGQLANDAQVSGEDARVSVEDTHVPGEAARVTVEDAHVSGEGARASVEDVHVSAEAAQASSEHVQASDEQVHVSDEPAPEPAVQVGSTSDLQSEILEAYQRMNRDWIEKAQSEVRLASEFSAKLAEARSLPEAAAAYRDWWTERLSLLAKDTEKLISGRYFG